MISHGVISGALFLCVGVIYDRMHTRDIAFYGGLVNRMPWYAAVFLLFTMGNVGLPGTSGFVGEILTMTGLYGAQVPNVTGAGTWTAFFASHGGDPVGGLYALTLLSQRRVMGEITNPKLSGIADLDWREVMDLHAAGDRGAGAGLLSAPRARRHPGVEPSDWWTPGARRRAVEA